MIPKIELCHKEIELAREGQENEVVVKMSCSRPKFTSLRRGESVEFT